MGSIYYYWGIIMDKILVLVAMILFFIYFNMVIDSSNPCSVFSDSSECSSNING